MSSFGKFKYYFKHSGIDSFHSRLKNKTPHCKLIVPDSTAVKRAILFLNWKCCSDTCGVICPGCLAHPHYCTIPSAESSMFEGAAAWHSNFVAEIMNELAAHTSEQ